MISAYGKVLDVFFRPPRFLFWFVWISIDFEIAGSPLFRAICALAVAFLINGIINLVEESSK